MSATEAEADRTPGVEPPIEPRAAWRVRDVRIIAHGLLDVRFVYGTEGIVDLRPRLGRDDLVGTLFEPLRDAWVLRAGLWTDPAHCEAPVRRHLRSPVRQRCGG